MMGGEGPEQCEGMYECCEWDGGECLPASGGCMLPTDGHIEEWRPMIDQMINSVCPDESCYDECGYQSNSLEDLADALGESSVIKLFSVALAAILIMLL